ncbi:MAG: ATP-binding protein [Phycisphaerae bacterium]|jgi:signal transduction histidine kinase
MYFEAENSQLIFYEIAMSIGNSLDLRKMLKECLATYLRKLNCSAGGIFMLNKDVASELYEPVITTPRSFYSGKTFQAILKKIPCCGDDSEPSVLQNNLPLHGRVDDCIYYHLLELPEFGYIILIKSNDDLDPFIIKSLKPLNNKLAQACLSCLHKTELEKTNTILKDTLIQLQDEISERRKTENSLKTLNEKLEQSNKELKDLTHIASHDLREPLRKVTAFARMIEISLNDKLSADDKENLDFIIEGAEHMQQMIKALRDYSMVISKPEKFEEVDLNVLVENIKRYELADEIKASGADIIVTNQLHHIKCDYQQVRQVIKGLLSNGIKHQKSDIKPVIKISSQLWDESLVRVEIQDNGIGIKQEELKNLFVIFKRFHSNKNIKSVNIDLAIVKRIVEQHGGNIGVSSTHGEGSTFWFTVLPASAVKDTAARTNSTAVKT